MDEQRAGRQLHRYRSRIAAATTLLREAEQLLSRNDPQHLSDFDRECDGCAKKIGAFLRRAESTTRGTE